jgi:hypothetical protein
MDTKEQIETTIAKRIKMLFNSTNHKADTYKDKVIITFEGGEEIQIGTFGWRFIDKENEILTEVIDDGQPGRHITTPAVTPSHATIMKNLNEAEERRKSGDWGKGNWDEL